MDADLWLRGLVIGLAIAAPVGPIGVLCIRRTLAEGRAIGFASGLGAATADAFYGSIAGLGITSLSSFLVGGTGFLRFFGGLFLIYLGVRTFLARPTERAAATSRGGLPAAYASTFLLTLANPATILSFAAVFAGLGAGSAGRGYAAALLLVGGVFCGSALCSRIVAARGCQVERSVTLPSSTAPSATVKPWATNRLSTTSIPAGTVTAAQSMPAV